MKRIKLTHSCIVLCLFTLSYIVGTNTVFAAKKPATGIKIEKITVGEERIDAGRKQLIEVLVKNYTGKAVKAKAKLSIILPNHNVVSFGNKSLTINSKSETRVLFPYPISKARGGDYTVSAKIYSLKGRVLAKSNEDQKKYFFAVDPSRKNQKPSRPGKKGDKSKSGVASGQEMADKPKKPLIEFDPPDLVIKELKILNNNSILRGESAHVRLIIANEGGDIASNVNYSVYWYFAPRVNRKKNTLNEVIRIIAPGEQKVLEIPITIPETELKGEYYVYAVLDESNTIKEISEVNNRLTTKEKIIFNDIALVYPLDSHSFAQDGLYIFEWRSRKFNQFKVQISTDEMFSSPDDLFEIPKGQEVEGWTPSSKIKPLSGEMPAMALNLLEGTGNDFLFWRVIAKDSNGNTSESNVRKFFIKFKADL